jgi:hypothetical protein
LKLCELFFQFTQFFFKHSDSLFTICWHFAVVYL